MRQLALRAWDALGGIDVLVNNAAIPKRRPVTALDPAEVEAVMRVNFFAPMRLTLAVLPRMLARDAGMIVNVSSVGGRLGIIHEAAYCASKFALCGWSEAMAVDLHGTGIVGQADRAGAGRHRDLGSAGQRRARSTTGPRWPPARWPKASSRHSASDRFEHYVPGLKAVVDAKNADIDAFIAGAAAMAPPMKALVSVCRRAVRRARRRQRADANLARTPSPCGKCPIRNRCTTIG